MYFPFLVSFFQPPAPSSMGYPMMGPQPQFITPPYSAPPPPPPPAQPTASDAMVPVLMAETRQQQGEIRMSIGKLSDKIDDLSNKVSTVKVKNLLGLHCFNIRNSMCRLKKSLIHSC